MITLRDLRIGLRFVRSVPGFLRAPIDPTMARRVLGERLAARPASFLRLMRDRVYGRTGSPYRQLLAMAGCEYGDVAALVQREGLECALRVLVGAGVYLSVEEFKGRRLVRRGSTTFTVEPAQFQDSRVRPHLGLRSSGSRGQGTPAAIDLDYVRERAVDACLALEARGGRSWEHAVWGVPGSLFMVNLLELAGFGAVPARWFSQIDPVSRGLHARYRMSARVMRATSVLAGVPLPAVRHVPLDAPLAIAHWIEDVRRAGRVPHMLTYASSAVRLCLAAREAGIELRGTQFSLTGEPLTPTRFAVIRDAGASAAPWYGTMESSSIGHACVAPEAPDDVHVLEDRLALVQPDGKGTAAHLPPDTLLLTSLRPASLFALINVSLGDQAVMSYRRCGCPMEAWGWRTHLHRIRSYEKLTAGGMTFLDADMVRVLEEVLPGRFGGAPTDYQLVEDEAPDGRSRVRLLVHPRVGPCDAEAVVDAFLRAIGGGDGLERVMGTLWREANLVRVERRAPLAGPTGKILHLHVARSVPDRLLR